MPSSRRSPVRDPDASGAVPGHGYKGPRRIEAAHQAPHIQLVALERAAQSIPGGDALHGPGRSGAWARTRARSVGRGGGCAKGYGGRGTGWEEALCDRKSPSACAEGRPGRGAPGGPSDTATLTSTPEFIISPGPRDAERARPHVGQVERGCGPPALRAGGRESHKAHPLCPGAPNPALAKTAFFSEPWLNCTSQSGRQAGTTNPKMLCDSVACAANALNSDILNLGPNLGQP